MGKVISRIEPRTCDGDVPVIKCSRYRLYTPLATRNSLTDCATDRQGLPTTDNELRGYWSTGGLSTHVFGQRPIYMHRQ